MTAASHSLARRATLLAASSLTVMSGATISPGLPGMQAHFGQVDQVELLARLVLTMPALFIVLSAPLAGMAVDRWGRRGVIVLCTLVYALAGASGLVLDQLPAILVGRAVLGIAVGGVMTAATTLIGDYFSGAERARFMGLQASAMAFGGVLFLSAGGLLAGLHWRGPFAVYLAALPLLLPMALTLYEPPRRTHGGPASPASAPRRWPALAGLYLAACIGMAAFYMVPVQLPFLMGELGLGGPLVTGLALAGSTLCGALSSLAYNRLLGRLDHPLILALAGLSLGLGFLLIGQAGDLLRIALAMPLTGFGMGLMMPNLSVWLMALAPPALRGRLVGGLTTAVFLGQFLSPLLTQPLVGLIGIAGTFRLVSGGLVAVAILVAGLSRRRGPRRGG